MAARSFMLLLLELGVLDVEEAIFAPVFWLDASVKVKQGRTGVYYRRFPVFRHVDANVDLQVAESSYSRGYVMGRKVRRSSGRVQLDRTGHLRFHISTSGKSQNRR